MRNKIDILYKSAPIDELAHNILLELKHRGVLDCSNFNYDSIHSIVARTLHLSIPDMIDIELYLQGKQNEEK